MGWPMARERATRATTAPAAGQRFGSHHQVLQRCLHHPLRLAVQGRGGLIQQQDLRGCGGQEGRPIPGGWQHGGRHWADKCGWGRWDGASHRPAVVGLTRGARSMARATARRCSWPPLSWLPPSPRRVAKPSGSASMKSRAAAARAAACTCCMLAPLPMATLTRMLALHGVAQQVGRGGRRRRSGIGS